MAQYIKQGNIFGRIGTGLGKGLAEQVPKEIERNRLASGLKTLSEQKGQTPFQQFSALAAIPGITPQMIQSGSELLRQQAQGEALANYKAQKNQPKPFPFLNNPNQQQNNGSNIPSITQEEPLSNIQQGYIPPTKEEELQRAGQLYEQNPATFKNSPEKAMEFVESETMRNQAINEANLSKHKNLTGVQDKVVQRLGDQYQRLGGKVPAELYSNVEDEAIQATKPKNLGGRGLTEQQAMKEYGEKLNSISKEWSKIPSWGSWGITQRSANETLRAMKATQETMEKLNSTDLFAHEMMGENKTSPKLSFAIAQPVKRVPALGNAIKQLPDIKIKSTHIPGSNISETLKISPQLGEYVKNNDKASPLAIAYELEKKGYDPRTWLQWVTDNSQKLNIRQKQREQLEVPLLPIDPIADWWLQSFSGIE